MSSVIRVCIIKEFEVIHLRTCKKLIKAAAHAGRKTITVDDIKFICE